MVLRPGSIGEDVELLQKRLAARGFSPGNIDGEFNNGTEAAVIAFQRSEGLLPDGVAGPKTLAALGLGSPDDVPNVTPTVTAGIVSQMFPFTPLGNIKTNLPIVLAALVAQRVADRPMVLMALATIRAETESFLPVAESPSRFNTSPNGHPFDLYDYRNDLGNQGPPDGLQYRGRGYVQLTGRENYRKFGQQLALGDELVSDPDRAGDAPVAARLLAAFLQAKEIAIKQALLDDDLKLARRLVNGGSHGLDRFTEAFQTGDRLIPRTRDS
jgi:peptidoglycan L-alanyl-D-glutamate endopeptidase CwlK